MIPKFKVYIKRYERMVYDVFPAPNGMIYVDFNGKGNYEFLYLTDGDVLMQSTGLKDKNGKEISEGDIVKSVSFASWIGVVKYSPENAAYILDDHNNEFRKGENVYLSQFNEGLEVKGNIYENPKAMET